MTISSTENPIPSAIKRVEYYCDQCNWSHTVDLAKLDNKSSKIPYSCCPKCNNPELKFRF